jgi:hypothetical protein
MNIQPFIFDPSDPRNISEIPQPLYTVNSFSTFSPDTIQRNS